MAMEMLGAAVQLVQPLVKGVVSGLVAGPIEGVFDGISSGLGKANENLSGGDDEGEQDSQCLSSEAQGMLGQGAAGTTINIGGGGLSGLNAGLGM
jgi:hypothetical protein